MTSVFRPAAVCSAILSALLLSSCASQAPVSDTVSVKVLAINDLHGNLKTPGKGVKVKGEDPAQPDVAVEVQAGGVEYIHTAVAELKSKNPNHVFVAAGDLIGASPLLSALFHDEPTIESLNLMGLDLAAVGNHEFDHGLVELLRKQNGGCHPETGCTSGQPFTGAKFQYLAASTRYADSGKTVLPAYQIKEFDGVPVAFIGLTLEGTSKVVSATGIAGLTFADEAETVNALVPELKAKGVEAIVVLIHEGGTPVGSINECPGISGPIVQIVKQLDKAIDLIVSGHTHEAYTCEIDGRLVTSGHRYGTLVTEIDLQLSRQSGDVVSSSANNLVVRHSQFKAEPKQTALIARYEALSAPLANRVVSTIGAEFSRELDESGASAMGQLLADAHLAATTAADKGAAVIALTNFGGVRAALQPGQNGQITFGDIYAVQPFSNNLVTVSLTGDQLRRILEQQFHPNGQEYEMLQVSQGFSYQWDDRKPLGQKIVPGSIKLNGQPLQMAQSYRVTINNFVASGADGFTVFTEATNPLTGGLDVDVLEQYLTAHPGIKPAAFDRVQKVQ
ncbi:bifunctional metallophosphatase/5'-nucleotidase [Rheinheimera marina]|uniref:Bifunctional metallophosphatase/5'-nucleotidase n=1 Tax=Rheinheimera marina TaxID=1774958 RepID=A0ABV9JHW4_9GAMM